ncbi:MAG TPA: disulfide bond formation protein DsbA [Cytophagales bacterium]|jgi:predicted DsbA family dithiol-disulfide isomerase|nr:disulfide bond formation protein DsbA [Cytophagales bacterium]
MNKPVIKIDVVSDVVCPWCYIGKRRLERAIDQLKNDFDFEVEYHPFELNPTMPIEGRDQKEYLSEKFGGEERYHQITSHTEKTAASEGLKFNFSIQKVSPNTLNAHRLIMFAKQKGKQAQVKEALMSAYFEKGIDLSKIQNLVKVAVENGLNSLETEAFLKSDELASEVKLEEQINYQRGISGVPFYIINNKYGVSGAQPTEAFVNAFSEIGAEVSTGESCDVDDKNC